MQYVFKWAMDAELISPLKDKIAQLQLSLYVDDVTVFIDPIQSDVVIMMHFGEATGLRINVNKSSVAPIRCLQINLDEVLQTFSGQRASFPITYLSLPVTLGRLKICHL
jgi:hypothetical protein